MHRAGHHVNAGGIAESVRYAAQLGADIGNGIALVIGEGNFDGAINPGDPVAFIAGGVLPQIGVAVGNPEAQMMPCRGIGDGVS